MGSPSDGADQSPEQDNESMTAENASDPMVIDETDYGDLGALLSFRLLPQVEPLSELLRGPRYQETALRVLPLYGSRCDLCFCCQCFIGPQVWKINLCCSNCQARACSTEAEPLTEFEGVHRPECRGDITGNAFLFTLRVERDNRKLPSVELNRPEE